ncbi:MAG: NADH-quinone oxidoreductase subunit J [Nakamurella sp.]
MIASLTAALTAAGAHASAATSDAASAAGSAGGAEQIVFWIVAPLALIGAVGMLFSRGAVHSALWLVVTMLCLGILYILQQAEFLGFAQIIVYTGAIMMLFLFVLMLTGRDAGDSVIEVLRGQRVAAGLVGLALVALLVTILVGAFKSTTSVGLGGALAERGAVGSLAATIFTDYLFPFELTSALLITAAIGAMVLAHVERKRHQKSSQRATVLHRMKSDRMSPLPGPGVHATSHSNATPGMLPDGSIAPGSVSEQVEFAVTERVAQNYRDRLASGDLLVPISGPQHPYRPRTAAVTGPTHAAPIADAIASADSAARSKSTEGSEK